MNHFKYFWKNVPQMFTPRWNSWHWLFVVKEQFKYYPFLILNHNFESKFIFSGFMHGYFVNSNFHIESEHICLKMTLAVTLSHFCTQKQYYGCFKTIWLSTDVFFVLWRIFYFRFFLLFKKTQGSIILNFYISHLEVLN